MVPWHDGRVTAPKAPSEGEEPPRVDAPPPPDSDVVITTVVSSDEPRRPDGAPAADPVGDDVDDRTKWERVVGETSSGDGGELEWVVDDAEPEPEPAPSAELPAG